MYSQIASAFRIQPALAGEKQNLTEQKVFVRRYHAEPGNPSCITFQVDAGPGSFVRIDDLEGRAKVSPHVRASEKRLVVAY